VLLRRFQTGIQQVRRASTLCFISCCLYAACPVAHAELVKNGVSKSNSVKSSAGKNVQAKDDAAKEISSVKDLIHDHKYSQAAFLLSNLVRKYPENSSLAMLYAELLQDMGQVDLASSEFSRAAQLAPKDPAPLISLVQLSLKNMELEASLNYAHQAVARNPEAVEAKLALIDVLLQCDLTAEAERQLKNLSYPAKDKPRVEQLAYRLSLKKGDLVGARVHLRNAIGSTASTQLHLEQSELLQSMGDRRAARDELQNILKTQPDSLPARLRLARLLETEYHDYSAALDNYAEALKLDPLSAQAIAGHDRCESKRRNIALQLKMAFREFLIRGKQEEEAEAQAERASSLSHIPN